MDLTRYDCFDVGHQSEVDRLTALHGLAVHANDLSNLVYVHPQAGRMVGHLVFHGQGNRILFGPGCVFRGEIVAAGSNARAMIHGGQHTLNLHLMIYYGARFELGRGTNAYGLRVWVGAGTQLGVGDGCLFSEGITVRTTDHHTLFDIRTLQALNPPNDVAIGAHVWLGQNVTILKGARIGSGAVVGAESLVSGPVPSCELWAGLPARMIRRNVSWTDQHPASYDDMRRRLSELRDRSHDVACNSHPRP